MAELVGAAKAAHEKKAKAEAPLRLPGFSSSRRFPHASLKDRVLAQPICPKSQIRGKLVAGHYEPPEIGPDDENCQLAGGQWWKMCEAKGHEPYFTNYRRVVTRSVDEIDEAGDLVPREKRVVITAKILNVTSISTSLRVGSGQAVRWKKRYFGFKEITDFGYSPVCDFSRCQQPVKFVVDGYGGFCGKQHLAMAAANDRGKTVTRIDQVDKYADDKKEAIQDRRTRELREAMDAVMGNNEL
jgi:hypothetical protein